LDTDGGAVVEVYRVGDLPFWRQFALCSPIVAVFVGFWSVLGTSLVCLLVGIGGSLRAKDLCLPLERDLKFLDRLFLRGLLGVGDRCLRTT